MKTNRRKPHRLPTGFWSWFLPVYRTTEEQVIEVAGMDACMYMRIFSFGELQSRGKHRRHSVRPGLSA